MEKKDDSKRLLPQGLTDAGYGAIQTIQLKGFSFNPKNL